MNPEEYFDSENVFTSSGRHIPEVLVKRAAKIYKKICDIVEGDAESDIVDSGGQSCSLQWCQRVSNAKLYPQCPLLEPTRIPNPLFLLCFVDNTWGYC